MLTLIRKDVDQTQVQLELDEIKEVAAQDTEGGVRELFRIARPALIAAVGIMLFQQLVGINSVIYFLPQVFIKGFGFPESRHLGVGRHRCGELRRHHRGHAHHGQVPA